MSDKKYNGYTLGRYGGECPEMDEMANLAREQAESVLANLVDEESLISVTEKVLKNEKT